MKKVLTTAVSVIILIGLLYAAYFIYRNMPYTASISLCDKTTDECKGYEAKVYLDTMDGFYFVEKIYTDFGEINFDECIVKTPTKKQGECKDTTGKEWIITIPEERGLF